MPVVVAAVCQVYPLRQVVAQAAAQLALEEAQEQHHLQCLAAAVVVYLPAQWGYRHLNRGVNGIGLSEAGSSV